MSTVEALTLDVDCRVCVPPPKRSVVPGAPAPLASCKEAAALAGEVGYPVMLKAAAGGGGRGMRLVAGPRDMEEAFARCQGEAELAFGDRALFLEKVVPRPRHIEVQVLGDGSGSVVHLHERDCSVTALKQRLAERGIPVRC